MAAPVPIYGPRLEVAMTASMAAAVRLAAVAAGLSRAEWVRQAVDAALTAEAEASS